MGAGYVGILSAELHFPENGSLKGKRKELSSLKEQLRHRFGASVAETGHQDLWQRSTLTAALVGRDVHSVDDAAAKLTRYVESRFPEGVRVERGLISADEILG